MKILLIAPGNSIHIERWCNWLRDNGNDIVLITDKETKIRTAKVYKLPNPHSHRYPFYWTIITQWNYHKVRSIVYRERPDIVHLHYASQYLPYKLDFEPFFVSVWGSDIFKLIDGSPGYQFTKRNLERARIVFTVSEQMKGMVKKRFPFTENKMDCFTWGIDTDFFKKGDRDLSRKELCLPTNGTIFLAPRGINEVYRPDLIIRAFNILKRQDLTVYLILLAGYASEERKRIIRKIIDNDPERIILINDTLAQDRMREYYNSSDFYVGIPLYDQISAALLEAMSCGAIPIVSDIEPYKGLIINGENGFVFEGDDPRKLSEILFHVINEDYDHKRMLMRNIDLVNQKFSWNEESKKMVAHYRNAMFKKSRT